MKARYTIFDIFAGVCILIFVLTLLLPTTRHRGESATRIKCVSNLRQIGQALLMYAADNKGQFPRTRWDPDAGVWNAFTNPNALDPFKSDGPAVNDVTAAMFMLLRTQDITPEVFVCPMTGDEKQTWPAGRTALNYSNFSHASHLSYGLTNPYPDRAALAAGWKEIDVRTGNAAEAIAADTNPGSPALLTVSSAAPSSEMKKVNSLNHDGDGQNVLFGDGHVDWNQTPFCGVNKENIYGYGPSPTGNAPTSSGGMVTGIVGSPIGPGDAVILPVQSQTTWEASMVKLRNAAFRARALEWGIWIACYGAVLLSFLWFFFWRGTAGKKASGSTP